MANDTTETVYEFICRYINEHGFSPSQREIAAACYLAQPTVIYHLDRLEAQRRIRREPGKPRSTRPTNF